MRKIPGMLGGTVLALFILITPVKAQQEPPTEPKKDEQPKPAASTPAWAPDGEGVKNTPDEPPPQTPPNPYAGTIKDIVTGLPLVGSSSTPLRWGSFSIFTFEYIGIHDNFDPAGAAKGASEDLAIFRTGIMFDHYLYKDKNRIVLQYLPQMAIYDGQIHANAAVNNTLSLGTKFALTPRLGLILSDSFTQTHSNPLIPQNYLTSDGAIGSATQNNFLTTDGSFIANSASAVLEYALSPRTSITFTGATRYAQTTNNSIAYQTSGSNYEGDISLAHALTARRTIGISNSYQYLNQYTSGSSQKATYNTTSFFYSEQLARTFWITANFGAVTQSYRGLQQSNGWGYNGNLSLLKTFFNRVSTTLAYTRGVSFNNFVSLERSDRVDLSVGLPISSRMLWSNGVGYYRELAGSPGMIGKYAVSDFRYRFAGNFSFFTTFSYQFIKSSTPQLLSGSSRTLAYGVRWAPRRLYSK